MIIGYRWWILIWYGLLLIGAAGLLASIYWGRETQWRNLDEVLRAIGTVTVSTGMLLLLYGMMQAFAQLLLVLALIAFVLAFVLGRRERFHIERPREPADDAEDGDDPA
ncbi:MAG: hypothetical protein AB7L66_14880 [Gemmatimonadales bacterium]